MQKIFYTYLKTLRKNVISLRNLFVQNNKFLKNHNKFLGVLVLWFNLCQFLH